jgi:hypothetical protein
VTGVIERQAAAVVEVWLTGAAEPIVATAAHPFWSVERCAWVAAGELEPGERVGSQATAWSDAAAGEVAGGSAAGGAAEVLAVLPVAGRVVVYNLEVRGGSRRLHITLRQAVIANPP